MIIENDVNDVNVVVINDLVLVEILVYLLCFDLVYGCLNVEVIVEGDMIKVGN